MLAKLAELIETNLTNKQRDAMHSLLNGMPVEVFAEKTGSNRNAVYKLVHDARAKLHQGFEQAGYKAEDINSVFA
jgi:RNA polymerase sigma-70 factor (ECF subfamily)